MSHPLMINHSAVTTGAALRLSGASWAEPDLDFAPDVTRYGAPGLRVLFLYLAQPHQVPHSLPLAIEMARQHREVEVTIATTTAAQQAVARRIAEAYGDSPLQWVDLKVPRLAQWLGGLVGTVPFKQPVLWANRKWLDGFDGIVVPERTSLCLKSMGVRAPLIWTSHGAGDRAVGYASDLAKFDFALLAGAKQEKRMLESGLIRPGRYHVGCYPKFDLVFKQPFNTAPLFDNGRKTVLYNPHFRHSLSSWKRDGLAILDWFAQQDRYNLIFAPHLRLFEKGASGELAERLQRYRDLPHLHIDLGSERSIDMTYTRAADIYLGDVSSQVTEFVVKPRPCVFINSHDVQWRNSPDYLFWNIGPVIDRLEQLPQALETAHHLHWSKLQRDYFAESFSLLPGAPTAPRSAEAIVSFLQSARA